MTPSTLVAFLVAAMSPAVAASNGPLSNAVSGEPYSLTQKHSKISSDVLRALSGVQPGRTDTGAAGPASGWLSGPRSMDLNEQGLQVYIEVRIADEATLETLRAHEVTVELADPKLGLVQGRIPLDRIEEVSGLPAVKFIRLPDHPSFDQQGSVGTEGDAVIRGDLARQNFAVDGLGIRVGVVSDGMAGLSEAIASGDLPPSGVSRSFRSDENLLVGAEGTALMEIIHDIAPGASLFFANFGTSLEFIQAVNWLATEAGGINPRRGGRSGVDVLVEDISFFNVGPYDGSSSVSRALTDAMAAQVAVFASAGNHAQRHYHGPFTDLDGDNLHEFGASLGLPAVNDAGETLNFTVQPTDPPFSVYLQWNDPFGASGNDYDLCLHIPADQPGMAPVLCSENLQDGDDDPVEQIVGILPLPSPLGAVTVGISVTNFQGMAAPKHLEVFVAPLLLDEFGVPGSSLANVNDALGAVAVGAVNWATPTVVEDFSSRGPTNDGRIKPDVVAPDAVSVTGAGGFPTPFFGTSAAAPHAGAVAALMLDANPDLLPDSVWAYLTFAAQDIDAPGADQRTGFGLLDAREAVRLAASRRATFSFVTNLLHLPAVSLPDGRAFVAFLRLAPGTSGLTFDVTTVARLARAPAPGDATFSFGSSTLDIPAVELSDGRVFRVTMTLVPGGSFLRFAVTSVQRLA